jgi:hypothetical protein
MKTTYYITTALASAIQMLTFGQIHDNHTINMQHGKTEVVGSHLSGSGKIRIVLNDKKEINQNKDVESYHKAMLNLVASAKELDRLEKEAHDLENKALTLRKAAFKQAPIAKVELLTDALIIETSALLVQLEALERSGHINYSKYNLNKKILQNLLKSFEGDDYVREVGATLIANSDLSMKMAREMREEAYAQLSFEAKVGNMSNAEEKEILALNQQHQALNLLDRNLTLTIAQY